MSDETQVEEGAEATTAEEMATTDAPETLDGGKTIPPADEKDAVQKRINRITAEKKTAQSETARLRQELEELRAQVAASKEVKPPKEDDFDSHEEFQQAVMEHKAEKIVAKKLEEKQVAELQRAEQRAFKEAADRTLANGEAEFTDYKDVVVDLAESLAEWSNPAREVLGETILGMEGGHKLAYHLGKNQQLRDELKSMKPVQIVAQLGKLLAVLEGSVPQEKKITNAPPPIKKVGSEGVDTSGDMDAAAIRKIKDPNQRYAAYKKFRQKQDPRLV